MNGIINYKNLMCDLQTFAINLNEVRPIHIQSFSRKIFSHSETNLLFFFNFIRK